MFFKTEGNKLIFTGDGELIYYIPEQYFDSKSADIIGNKVSTIGMFTYAVFEKNGKRSIFKQFNCPTTFECIPSIIEKENKYHLEGTSEEKAYRLLHFKKGDELICSLDVPASFDNIKIFNNLFKRGNLPESIPYNEIQNYFFRNAELSDFDYKVSYQIIGIPISEIYRSKTNPSKPFRLSKTDDMLAYKAISIDQVPKYTSPFAAVTSDNADEAIAAAITMDGRKDSPLEKIVMN